MNHDNRSLPLATSRFSITLNRNAGRLVDQQTALNDHIGADGKTTQALGVVSETYEFTNQAQYNLDDKFRSALVKLRSAHVFQEQSAPPPVIVDEPEPALLGHANLDGADDHLEITLPDNTTVLSWAEDWSLAFHMIEIHNASEGTKRTIATRGNNGMYFSKGSGNWGFYASATDGEYDPAANEGMTHSHGANTWFTPPDDSKHLFTYKASTGKLRWYCNGVLKATVQMTATEMTKGVLSTDTLNVGDAMAGYYGSSYWDGHIDNLLVMSTNLVDSSAQVTEYFSNNEFDTHLEYYDKVLSWFTLDPNPATYPEIKDERGYATGEHVGGNADTAFVTTGVFTAVSEPVSVEVAPVPIKPNLVPSPLLYFSLPSHSLPNTFQNLSDAPSYKAGASSQLLGVMPLDNRIAPTLTLQVQPAVSGGCDYQYNHEFAGSVGTDGRLVSGTVINGPLQLTIFTPKSFSLGGFLEVGSKTDVGSGAGVPVGLSDFTVELDVQLLLNPPNES